MSIGRTAAALDKIQTGFILSTDQAERASLTKEYQVVSAVNLKLNKIADSFSDFETKAGQITYQIIKF
jgi:hypothetical protein